LIKARSEVTNYMTKSDITAALEQAGLAQGRVLSAPDTEVQGFSNRFRTPSQLVRNAAVAETPTNPESPGPETV
jgi:hypothetical protein